jgi:hypothetical protein
MKYFGSVEEIFLIHWGILPTLKRLRFERVHMEGNIIFIDKEEVLVEHTCKSSVVNRWHN